MKIIKAVAKLSRNLKLFIPFLYCLVFVLGVFLFLFTKIFPKFDASACIILGGRQVCTLVGIYISTIISLPGYILLGSLLRIAGLDLPVVLSYILVFLTNLISYYFIGGIFQKIIKSKDNPDKYAGYLVIYAFIFLLIIYFILSTA